MIPAITMHRNMIADVTVPTILEIAISPSPCLRSLFVAYIPTCIIVRAVPNAIKMPAVPKIICVLYFLKLIREVWIINNMIQLKAKAP